MTSQFNTPWHETLMTSIDSLFTQLEDNRLSEAIIHDTYKELTVSVLDAIQHTMELKSKQGEVLQISLINCYPIASGRHWISLAVYGKDTSGLSRVNILFHLVAEHQEDLFNFSVPLAENTKYYHRTPIGQITYYHRGPIDTANAKKFDEKNQFIAKKLGLTAEPFRFFMCDHYQEILRLLGIDYEIDEAGKFREGYGVVGGCIFSIINNEDFSHDIFHYYSGKINQRSQRNWITEEGIAYSWGNAYYTDANGNMIEQSQLLSALKDMIKNDPQLDVLDLFEKNVKCFESFAPEVSARSLISSLICDLIEQNMGMEGLLKLINCGRSSSLVNYFGITNELVGINRSNFNEKVLELIKLYEKQ
jgi:hypothetical protein